MTIRPLTNLTEFQQCVDLSRECFGMADIDLFPKRLFVVLSSIGGLVLGALDGDKVIGFLNSMPAIRDGEPYWYSQVMAVARDYWNAGTATQLKLAQRDHARQRGIQRIEWTFDPRESKNAYFNLQKLGAIVRRYHVNYYGEISSALHSGLDSDRVVAEWWIDKPRIQPGADVRRVFIPADIQFLKKQSLDSAKDVQIRVREQFLKNLQDDYFAAGFERTDEWSAYLFVPGASRVHQTD